MRQTGPEFANIFLCGAGSDAVRAGIGGFIVFGVFVMWTYWMNRASVAPERYMCPRRSVKS